MSGYPKPELTRRGRSSTDWIASSPANLPRPFAVLGTTRSKAEDEYYRCYARMVSYGWLPPMRRDNDSHPKGENGEAG